MDVLVREAVAGDYESWFKLWNSYNSIGGSVVGEEVTSHTWRRVIDPASPVLCRIAEYQGEQVGFVLCVLHEGTYFMTPVCYLEDFFVKEELRGKGIGKAVLKYIHDEAKEKGWAKVYWFTRINNPARKLYDKVATSDDFVRYRMNIDNHM